MCRKEPFRTVRTQAGQPCENQAHCDRRRRSPDPQPLCRPGRTRSASGEGALPSGRDSTSFREPGAGGRHPAEGTPWWQDGHRGDGLRRHRTAGEAGARPTDAQDRRGGRDRQGRQHRGPGRSAQAGGAHPAGGGFPARPGRGIGEGPITHRRESPIRSFRSCGTSGRRS